MLKNYSDTSCFSVCNDNVFYWYWHGDETVSVQTSSKAEPTSMNEIPAKVRKVFDNWIFHTRTKRYYEILLFLSFKY